MPRQTIRIPAVIGGQSPLQYFGGQDQYQSAIAIDPDFPIDDSAIRASGFLRPTAMEKFSGSEITGVPLWFVTNAKTNSTYLYANDGKVHTVDSDLTMGTALNSGTALTASSGNGAGYYDNNAYFAKNTDIAQYGPLDGTPSLTQDFWTNTLSLTALTDTTYPSIRGIEIPNHPMHRHTNDVLYFADVNSDNEGIISYIKTSKTTNEGDTNNGSTYNALDFDKGIYPTCLETYQKDLVIGLIEGTDTTIRQKPAQVAFWDTTSSSFQKIVPLPDPLITALKNVNGILYAFTGNASGGVRVLRFAGGYSFQEVAYLEEGVPPFHGAVDSWLNRISWGAYTTDPISSASVYSLGSKMSLLGTPLHNTLKSTSSGANGMVTALKYLEQANNSRPRPIIGWTDDSAKGLDKISTTYGTSVWRSQVFRIGQPFTIKKITIPLAQAVAANMTLTPKLLIDEESTTKTLTTINSTNLPNSERVYKKFPNVRGTHNFYLELTWSGTALLTVSLPITIEIETEVSKTE